MSENKAVIQLEDGGEVTAEFEVITPEIAQELLDQTDSAGKMDLPDRDQLRQHQIDLMAEDMEKGEFYIRNRAMQSIYSKI